MAKTLPARSDLKYPAGTFAVVASEYNGQFIAGLLEHFTAEIEILAPGSTIVIHRVPGSFELPLAVKEVAEQKSADAITAFGLLFEGETMHASLIATTVTQALMQISLKRHVPVLHEVLVVKDEAQAKARCMDAAINRGTEAARAAVGMVDSLRRIRG